MLLLGQVERTTQQLEISPNPVRSRELMLGIWPRLPGCAGQHSVRLLMLT